MFTVQCQWWRRITSCQDALRLNYLFKKGYKLTVPTPKITADDSLCNDNIGAQVSLSIWKKKIYHIQPDNSLHVG